MKQFALMGIALVCACSCGTKKGAPEQTELQLVQAPARPIIGSEPVSALPHAVIYKMNGDYADKVAIQVDAQGNVVSFPAPQDVKGMEPVALKDGWYLSRQGIGPNSVLTRWTFAEYSALKSVPTIAELKAAILPAAKITEIKTLPMLQSEALENPQSIVLPTE